MPIYFEDNVVESVIAYLLGCSRLSVHDGPHPCLKCKIHKYSQKPESLMTEAIYHSRLEAQGNEEIIDSAAYDSPISDSPVGIG